MTFGTNAHLKRVDVKKIYSEITGRPVGRVVRHGSGKEDVTIKPKAIRTNFEQIEDIFKMHPNDFRRLIYERHRQQGLSHEEVVHKLFPERKVTV